MLKKILGIVAALIAILNIGLVRITVCFPFLDDQQIAAGEIAAGGHVFAIANRQRTARISTVDAIVGIVILFIRGRIGHVGMAADTILCQHRLHIFRETDGSRFDSFYAIFIGIVIAHVDAPGK